jgi:hypothetical protein
MTDDSGQQCPQCNGSISADDINIKEGAALCPGCKKLLRLSELLTFNRPVSDILNNPPSGCSIVADNDRMIVTASLKSVTGFMGATFIALFWNGITSVFVLIAIAGLCSNLVGPLPNWFPAPAMNDGRPEMNNKAMSLGMSLFLCVFLIPFVTVGTGMVCVAIMNLLGKIEVVIDEYDSYVATGIGFLRWKKRFDPRLVQAVEIGTTAWQTEGKSNALIEIRTNNKTKFGSLLKPERMEWMLAVLRGTLLSPRNNSSTLPELPWLHRTQR